MITFTTPYGQYKYPQSLKDVTLRKYLEYVQFVEPQIPKCLQAIRDAETEDERHDAELSITEIDDVKFCIPYYATVIEFFTGLSARKILGKDNGESMRVDHIKALYIQIQKALHDTTTDDWQNVIEHNGELWYLPTEAMKDSTFIEYAEASTFKYEYKKLEGGDWMGLPKLMCVIVRKEGEQYSEKLLSRTEMFLEWPMDKVFYVAFFLHRLSETYLRSLETYTAALKATKLRQGLKDLATPTDGI